MLQEIKRMPEPLRRQLLLRLGLCILFFVLLIVLIITAGDIYLCLPCAGVVVFFAATAFLLFRKVALGDYVVVNGDCTEVGLTTIKRRAKYLIMESEAGQLKVMLRGRLRRIVSGSQVCLYITKNTPLYEQNGMQMLYTYIAIDVK